MGLLRLAAIAAAVLLAQASKDEYDFVIVGGGLAGCVLANRLTASHEHKVLLLSAGGAPPQAYSGPVLVADESRVPGGAPAADDGLRAHIHQPGYTPAPHFATEESSPSPARLLGGNSLWALSLYLRDHPEALDSWGEGWSWHELKPYFHRAEGLEGTKREKKEYDYGEKGPFAIQGVGAYVHPLTHEFVAAAKEAGLRHAADLNTEKGHGVGYNPTFQRADGTKAHAYDAYMYPAMNRSNLKVLTGVRADRLIIRGGRHVEGVAYRNLHKETDHVVYARKEVILSSGYVYSPRLLFLSGIGDKSALDAVGLEVVKHLPAVGRYLTAARFSPLAWTTDTPTLSQFLGPPISDAGAFAIPEAYGSAVLEATARLRSKAGRRSEPHARRPDIVLSFMPLYYTPESAPLPYSLKGEAWPLVTNAYTILATLGETKAKGEVQFVSGSPDRSPVVVHEPLTHHEDLEKAKEAVEWAVMIGNSTAFSNTTAQVDNGAGAPHTFSAVYDGRGTCRIGKDHKTSVVDGELKVHGLKGLRVVDGSVIPVGSPYMAVPEVLAVAERGAELILKEHCKEHHRCGAKRIEPFNGNDVTIATLNTILGDNFTLLGAVEYLASEADDTLASRPAIARQRALGAAAAVGLAAAVALGAASARRGKREAADGHAPLLA